MKKLLLTLLTWVFLLFFVASCSPVYKIAHDYKPPVTKKGLSCLRGCQDPLNQCNQQCSVKFNQCSAKARSQAKKTLPTLKQEYTQQLEQWLNARERYQNKLDLYELKLKMAEARRDRQVDHCIKQGQKKWACTNRYGNYLSDFPYTRPSFSIRRPSKPTLNTAALGMRIRLNCSKNCGCQSSYRLCYTSCGGVVNSKKVCIKNCDN